MANPFSETTRVYLLHKQNQTPYASFLTYNYLLWCTIIVYMPREYENITGIESIRLREHRLRELFLKAMVTDRKKGYVSAPGVNQLIDVGTQEEAACLVGFWIREIGSKIDKVVGIPYSGVPFATSVAGELKVPLAPGRKGDDIPGSWQETIIVEEEVPSFTTGVRSKFVYNNLPEGDTVLIVDDVVAHGDTAVMTIKEFNKRGITTYLAVYFAKLFQPGVQRIIEETGVEPFYVIGIQEISDTAIKKLSPPQF
jgi:adenine/guanine phosphoribosyltransferase-like PRPP-binding protein